LKADSKELESACKHFLKLISAVVKQKCELKPKIVKECLNFFEKV